MIVFPKEFTAPNKRAELTPRVNRYRAIFGDGYDQRVAIGINTSRRVYKLVWTGLDAPQIMDWIEERKGTESFLFTFPGDKERSYICEEYSLTINTPAPSVLNVTFEEVFEL